MLRNEVTLVLRTKDMDVKRDFFPQIGTMEMPDSMETAIQEFQQAVATACPDVKNELDSLQEDLLMGTDYKDV